MKIAVIGDIIVDKYISGSCSRISPEAPVPVIKEEKAELILGGAANVFNNLLGLGAKPLLIGVVGLDGEGNFVRSKTGGSGVLVRNMQTTVKTRIVSGNQQIVRLDNEEYYRSTIDDVNRTSEMISEFKPQAIIVSSYGKGFVTKELVDMLKETGCLLVADPKDDLWIFDGFDTITPNEKEYTMKPTVKNILVTLGAKGMKLINSKGEFDIPSIARDVYDVTGAGDTVTAVYTFFRCKGFNPLESARCANAAAGLVVGKFGTSTLTYDEIQEYVDPFCNIKTIEKSWGKEVWIANSQLYCGKILYVKQGYICSYHHHEVKDETFYVLSGKIEMKINDESFVLMETENKAVRIKPYDKHSFAGIVDSVILEISTQHFESDSYREDKSGVWKK